MTRYLFQLLLATLLTGAVSVVFSTTVSASPYQQKDTTKPKTDTTGLPGDSSAKKAADTTQPKKDSLRFPLYDRRGDPFSNPNRNPFDLKTPPNIHDSIQYDPVTQQYYIIEKVGDQYYRKPTYLTFDELMYLQSQQSQEDYFRIRADALYELNRKLLRPNLTRQRQPFLPDLLTR